MVGPQKHPIEKRHISWLALWYFWSKNPPCFFIFESVTFKMTHFGSSCYAKTFYNMHVSYESYPIITYHEEPKCVILNVKDSFIILPIGVGCRKAALRSLKYRGWLSLYWTFPPQNESWIPPFTVSSRKLRISFFLLCKNRL